jgi:hypothetical protein
MVVKKQKHQKKLAHVMSVDADLDAVGVKF